MLSFSGVVLKGIGRANKLGFPTINIPLSDESVSGIYAARVRVDSESHVAAAYGDQRRKLLEAYLIDTSLDLYGKEVAIELYEKIRDDRTFENDEELQAEIARDVVKIREYFEA